MLIIIAISYIAIHYEAATGDRLFRIQIMIILYIVIGLVRSYLLNNTKTKLISFIIELSLVFLLEMQTKYIINYAFNVFYILILFEISISLSKKLMILIGTITVSISLVKYINMLTIVSNYSKITETLFFAFISIFILIIIIIFKYYKEEKEKTEELNAKLVESLEKIEELTLIKERNRIASELHDSIGHKLTGLIMQLEMAEYYIDNSKQETRKLIIQSKQNSRDSLKELREVVEALKEPCLKGDFIPLIRELSNKFSQMTKIEVNLNNSGREIKLTPEAKIVLYKIIQEALTNSAKHGNVKKVDIIINYLKDKIEIIIKDDGIGCNQIIKGNGLDGITKKVESLNGIVSFNGDNGFEIKLLFNMEDNK